MMFYALRGAISVKKNSKQDILDNTSQLLNELIDKNNLNQENMVSIIFTATKDLNAAYPAVAAREMGITDVPLMCCQEMDVDGSLSKCIRVLIHAQFNKRITPNHIYMGEAVVLRPDIVNKNKSIEGKI